MSGRIRVVVADDHPLVRAGVARALTLSGQIEVVGELGNGRDALAAIAAERPDVAVLDFRMPGMDGVQVAAAVRRDGLRTKVLLLSAHDDAPIVYNAIQQGAHGFLTKDADGPDIVRAVRDCAAGRTVLPAALAAGLAAEVRLRRDGAPPVLSVREREVLRMMADGKNTPTMAAELFVAKSTVKTHVQRLYAKLGVADRGAAVAEAMRSGLLE